MDENRYNEIMRAQYEDLSSHSNAIIPFEEYSCKVDCQYRCDFGLPPQTDEKAEFRLKSAAVKVGQEYIVNDEEVQWRANKENRLQYMKDRLLAAIEDYLDYKTIRLKAPFPLNRRFKRKDVTMLEGAHLKPEEVDEFGGFGEAFETLFNEGYYRVVEEGGHSKHDVFQALAV
jgi:hypothetical protein